RKFLVVNPLKLFFALEQPFLGDRDQEVAINQLVEKRQIVDQRDFAHDLLGIEARVLGAVDDKAKKGLEIERVVRSGGHEHGIVAGAFPIAGGVAGGAIVGDARKADGFFREADRQLL